jgi:Zn-dependent peptidase ImmA (M78 family)/predicted secreted protein
LKNFSALQNFFNLDPRELEGAKMSDLRSDILLGHKEAERVHRQFDTRSCYLQSGARIDVYRLAHDLGIPVVFRPLEGLLGVYVKDPAPGILLTTQRPESVQRLTCAHELGHHWLKHVASYDVEGDVGAAFGKAASRVPPIERQADAFAFNLLMPRWLLAENIKHLQQLDLYLPNPVTVYQLAVRIGTSYMACALTLSKYNFINASDLATLLTKQPKDIKARILADIAMPDWHRDIWLLSEADDGMTIEPRQGDVLVAHVREASTAGYSLEINGLTTAGFTVLTNREVATNASSGGDNPVGAIGTFPLCETVAVANQTGQVPFEIRQKRPWEDNDGISVIHLDVKVKLPSKGLSELDRAARMRAACVA